MAPSVWRVPDKSHSRGLTAAVALQTFTLFIAAAGALLSLAAAATPPPPTARKPPPPFLIRDPPPAAVAKKPPPPVVAKAPPPQPIISKPPPPSILRKSPPPPSILRKSPPPPSILRKSPPPQVKSSPPLLTKSPPPLIKASPPLLPKSPPPLIKASPPLPISPPPLIKASPPLLPNSPPPLIKASPPLLTKSPPPLIKLSPPPPVAKKSPPTVVRRPPPPRASKPPPPLSITPAPTQYGAEDEDLWIGLHNTERGDYDVDQLDWNRTLANRAQGWANVLRTRACASADPKSSSAYRPTGPAVAFGQNVWLGTSSAEQEVEDDADVPSVFDVWANQRDSFNLTSAKCAMGAVCRGWLQIVWNTTASVGCGVATCVTTVAPVQNVTVVVCDYDKKFVPGQLPFTPIPEQVPGDDE